MRLPSETEEARLFSEDTATHLIGESEDACEFAPVHLFHVGVRKAYK